VRPVCIRMPALLVAGLVLPVSAVCADEPKSLADVVVLDQRDAQIERKHQDIQKIIISEVEVERYGDATVGDVLRRLPGMTFTGPAGVTKDIRIRGLDKGYTQFLINGEPIPSAKKERQIQVDRLPADMIERIEIIRSPGAMYDSAGIGGTINIVLKRRADGVTRLRAAAGRNGDLDVGDVVAQWSRSFGNLDVLLAASHTVGAEDVKEDKVTYNANGTVKNAEPKAKPVKKDETLFAPRFVWHFGEDRLTLEPFMSNGREMKDEDTSTLNGSGTLTKRTLKDEDKSDNVSRLGGRYDGRTSWGDWFVKAGSQEAKETKDVESLEYNAAGNPSKRTIEDETLRERGIYAGTGVSFALGANHTVSAGLEWRDGEYRNEKTKIENGADKSDAKDRFTIDETRQIFYLQDEWRISDAHGLTPGIRVERTARESRDSADTSRKKDLVGTMPSLHYRWALQEDLNLRASVAKSVKLPKYDELNPFIKLESGVYKGGNPDLKPETAVGYELGLEQYFWGNRGIVGVNVYRRDVEDFVQKEQRVEGGLNVERPYNVGEAMFWGAELDWRVPLLRNGPHELSLTGNHSEMRGRVKVAGVAGSSEVKDMPRRMSNIGLDWLHRPTMWSAGININHQPRFTTNGINADGVREVKTREQQTLLDLYVGWAASSMAELRLIAKNVLAVDKEERTVKYTAAGAFSSDEWKRERSSPMVMMTLESRF